MNNILLDTDFYKLTHILQYPKNITNLTSYFVPRSSRLPAYEFGDRIVFFGLSLAIKRLLVDGFDQRFFKLPFAQIKEEITDVLKNGLLYDVELIDQTIEKIEALHKLGYLPVCIRALPEGSLVPVGIPCVEITSTHPDMAWVSQSIEVMLSASLWHPIVSATIARRYAQIAKFFYNGTVDDCVDYRTAMCDFSLRGQESVESGTAASVAWLSAMFFSSTVAARHAIKATYDMNHDDSIIMGLTSTEHSVMTTHAALDNMEEWKTYRRLLDMYKNISFSIVCDSYDFWNVVENILPKFKDDFDERAARGKFVGIRHDSADPVDAIAGIPVYNLDEYMKKNMCMSPLKRSFCINNNGEETVYLYNAEYDYHDVEKRPRTIEEKGMVEVLGDLFGTTVNSKGYKVIHSGLKAVYGDSITIQRAGEIYQRLERKGYAANNVSLGVGSFSFQTYCNDFTGKMYPFTRDTFSCAQKTTYAEYKDGDQIKSLQVFKSPKGFTGKVSHKGLCLVEEDKKKGFKVTDGFTKDTIQEHKLANQMRTYFDDGVVYRTNFKTVRDTVAKSL